jgi:hypothetical protein
LAEADPGHASKASTPIEEGGAMKIKSQIIGGGVGWTG